MARGGCWLQGEACQVNVLRRFKGFKVFKGLEGCKGLEGLEGFQGLEGVRAGKRQTWTPIRSH